MPSYYNFLHVKILLILISLSVIITALPAHTDPCNTAVIKKSSEGLRLFNSKVLTKKQSTS